MFVVATEAGKKPEAKSTAVRLQEAIDLPRTIWKQAQRLAKQLEEKPILPVIGAGASVDCGMPLSTAIAERLYSRFEERGFKPKPSDLYKRRRDLGMVADALYVAGSRKEMIAALKLDDKSQWPDVDDFQEHFCSYRILSRLAREGLIAEAITLNYDSAFERGLDDEGFQFEPWPYRGRTWLDHATVVTDGPDHVQLDQRGELVLTKAHGCAASYRQAVAAATASGSARDKKRVEEIEGSIVIRRGQLLDWRTDFWARDLFADRARRHVVLLLGVSGEDAVIHVAFTRVLQEVYKHLGDDGGRLCKDPRVIAIDLDPNSISLSSLINEGCGGRDTEKGVVTKVKIPKGKSMTAVLTAVATEMLALCLARQGGLLLPADPQTRVVSLMAVVPPSLRWTYLLERRRKGVEYAQRINLEHVGDKGYVPFRTDFERVARSLRLRNRLRGRLRLEAKETVGEVLSSFGFVRSVRTGCAFMPLGITADELRAIPNSDLRLAAGCLDAPLELEPVLVAEERGRFVGRTVATGGLVRVP